MTNLSDELVSISTLNFSMEATSSAIFCFSAEAGSESNKNALYYPHLLHLEYIIGQTHANQLRIKNLPAFIASLASCSSNPKDNPFWVTSWP